MKSVGAGMTKASVPKRDIGMKCNRATVCRSTAWVEIIGRVISVQNPPGASILNRKTEGVKLNSDGIFTSKSTNRTGVFN